MTLRRLFVFPLLLALSAGAADLKLDSLTVGSETFSNVTLLGANATDLYFKYDHGLANVKLKYLSPELQKRFNYDPKAAADAERKQAEADANYHTRLASKLAEDNLKARQAATNALPAAPLEDPISDKSLLGKAAPMMKLTKWAAGEQPDITGKYVLVTFWAPWSSACKQTIPELNDWQKKFADKLVVIGITTNSAAQVSEMTGPKLEFPSAVDTQAAFAAAANVTSIPSVLLLDPSGVVRYQGHPGAISEQKLQDLLAGQ